MKRDMELVRWILMSLEGDADAAAEFNRRSPKERAYHVALLAEAGLIVAKIGNDSRGFPATYLLLRLTWQGHEFLDALRDDNLWNKAKQHVLKPGASWTFEVLKEWAKYEVKTRLGIPG